MSQASKIGRARRLRREMTSAERQLWGALRAHRLADLHFRRQAPCGPYFADFLCAKARLVVEIDGATHSRSDEVRRDALRDAWLEANGYRVLRLQNAEVYENLQGAVETILAVARTD
jgi:very-short-patch-repair endonuclease